MTTDSQVDPPEHPAQDELAPSPQATTPKRSLVLRLSILAVTLLMGVVALELAARVVLDRDGMNYGIEMWKYSKLLKRKSDVHAMGHEHVPDSQAQVMGVDVSINSHGMRDREYEIPKPPGVYRILALGDSLTFGFGATVDETYTKVLERLLNDQPPPGLEKRVEVLNTGVGNYNTAQEVGYYFARGKSFEPDMVVIGVSINDGEPTPRPNPGFFESNFYLAVLANHGLDALSRKTRWNQSFSQYYEGLYEDGQPGWDACRKAFADLISDCQNRGIPVVAIQLPELHNPGKNYPFQAIHTAVRDAIEPQGAVCIDLASAFEGHEPASLWVSPGDPHPNAKAHRIFAETVHRQLLQQWDSFSDTQKPE